MTYVRTIGNDSFNMIMNLSSLTETAHQASVSYRTAWRYAHADVFEWCRDHRGVIRCETDAVEKIRQRFRERGGPGGRPIAQV